jgi:hypothetical protein
MYKCKYDIEEEEENVQHEHTKTICDYFTDKLFQNFALNSLYLMI